MAEFMGVAQNTISAWKKRNSMNYDLLFEKCAHHDLDLNWIVYGDEVIHQLNSPEKEDEMKLSSAPLDQRALKCMETIKSLPWNVSTRRKLLENYIDMVHEELRLNQSASGSEEHKEMTGE